MLAMRALLPCEMSPMAHIPFPWNQHPRDDSHCTVLLFGISSPSTFYPLYQVKKNKKKIIPKHIFLQE